MPGRAPRFVLAALALCLATAALAALAGAYAQEAKLDLKQHYRKSEHMVPMRDGAHLFTIVYEPLDASHTYPFLLRRTPYSIRPYGPEDYRSQLGPSPEFDRDSYIFVFQDVRGKFKSEGEFQVIKPHNPNKKTPADVDEASDTYDTIEWLLKNVPNHNGRVGQWGVSYDAWETVMAMIEPHPALRAASPQASPSDMFIGDDWHHNGGFRLMYAFSWLAGNARTRSGPSASRSERFDYGTPWGYRFFLEAATVGRINQLYFQDQVPAWKEFMEHGTYDHYWQVQNATQHLKNIRVPTLNVAGWFDAEDFYGPMSIYYTIEKETPENRSTLVVGPWRHGGWISMKGESLGDIRFGSETSLHFQQQILFPFFRYYLKDEGEWSATEAIVFETGANQWKSYDQWPPRGATPTKLYFHAGGRLSFDPPMEVGPAAHDAYVSDPAKPVPFSAEVRTTQGHLWMIEDQRFAATRPDVLVYQTEPLTEDVTIAGPILASLRVSATGTDADFVVKLIDVYPGDAPDNDPNPRGVRMGDFQMLLAGEVFRAKFRNSYSEPEPLVPGQVTPLEFDLRDRYHTFRRGHRIMVQVQSTWFPVIDRNPQRFLDIYQAQPSDFQKATHKVHRSRQHPSHLLLPVLKKED